MNIRFYNARILTMKSEEIIEGELWTNGDSISYVGPSVNNTDKIFEREIDCHGNLIMPSFKNAHTHTAMTFSRSLADNYQLEDWLHKAIFPREAKLEAEHIYWFTKLGMAEYIANGITSAFDMYFQVGEGARAAKEAGMRYVFCGSVNDFGGMDRLENEFNTYNSYDPLVSYVLGFHAEYTTSMDIMKQIVDLSQKYKAPVYAHNSETENEVKGCIERYGKTPVKLLNDIGMYDYGGGGFHCVWFNDEDMNIYKDKGLTAVFNACSNLKLASGMAPVYKFVNNGINVAIGTDGAGSNNALDMFREMYLCTTESNILTGDPTSVDSYQMLKAATTVGAKAMGLTDCDVLEVGKKADLIVIDMNKPNMHPVNNIVRNIVYSGNPSNIKMTICNGQILYEDGQLKTLDVNEIYSHCNNLMETLR